MASQSEFFEALFSFEEKYEYQLSNPAEINFINEENFKKLLMCFYGLTMPSSNFGLGCKKTAVERFSYLSKNPEAMDFFSDYFLTQNLNKAIQTWFGSLL